MDIEDKKALKNGDIVVVNRYLVDEKDSFPPFSPLLLLSTDSSSYFLSPLEKPDLTFTIPISSPLQKIEEVEKEVKRQERIWKIHNICFVLLTSTFVGSIAWNLNAVLKKLVKNLVNPTAPHLFIMAVIAILLFFAIIAMELLLTYTPSEIREFKEGRKKMEEGEKVISSIKEGEVENECNKKNGKKD